MPSRMEWSQVLQMQQRQVDVDFRHQPVLPPRKQKLPIWPQELQTRSSLHRPPSWMLSRIHWNKIPKVQQRQVDVDFLHQPVLPPIRQKLPIWPPELQKRSCLHRPTHWMCSRLQRSQVLQVQQRQVDVDFRHQPILPRRTPLPIRPPLV